MGKRKRQEVNDGGIITARIVYHAGRCEGTLETQA
jgi:hypothetical protein